MIQVPYYPLKRVNDSYGQALAQEMLRVIESGWFIRGTEDRAFEEKFAAYCGVSHCVGVGNGLEALSLILKGLVALKRLQPGDGVVVPSNTFIATWLAVMSAGLLPVPAEPDEGNFLISASTVREALGKAETFGIRVRAILAVHLYGRLCPMLTLAKLACERNLVLLEDAAQAHGAALADVAGNVLRAGHLSMAAGFSFYPGKNLGALGDGGAVVTDDVKLAQVVRELGNYGSSQKYVHLHVGENSRLDEIQAAVLMLKLKTLDSDNARRGQIAARYLTEIKNDAVRLPPPATACGKFSDCVWHVFPVHSAFRDELQRHLKELKIETLVHYPVPPNLQPAFAGDSMPRPLKSFGSLPIAERLAKEELSLPLFPQMTNAEISAVIEAVNSFKPCRGA